MATLKLERILFATDLSKPSRQALEYVLKLARKTGARLIAVHVVGDPVPAESSVELPEAYRKQLWEAGRQQLDQQFEELGGEQPVAIEKVLLREDPVRALGALARERKADLLVVAKRQSPDEGRWRGSTLRKLLRQPPCPILVVPDRGKREVRWDPMVCGIDFSDTSKRALLYASHLARTYSGKLQILHVVQVPPLLEGLGEHVRLYVEATAKAAAEKLRQWARESDAPARTEIRVREGDPRRVIVEQAAEAGSDLLVIGSCGHSFLEKLMVGSATKAILETMRCPVLVIPQA